MIYVFKNCQGVDIAFHRDAVISIENDNVNSKCCHVVLRDGVTHFIAHPLAYVANELNNRYSLHYPCVQGK